MMIKQNNLVVNTNNMTSFERKGTRIVIYTVDGLTTTFTFSNAKECEIAFKGIYGLCDTIAGHLDIDDYIFEIG